MYSVSVFLYEKKNTFWLYILYIYIVFHFCSKEKITFSFCAVFRSSGIFHFRSISLPVDKPATSDTSRIYLTTQSELGRRNKKKNFKQYKSVDGERDCEHHFSGVSLKTLNGVVLFNINDTKIQ